MRALQHPVWQPPQSATTPHDVWPTPRSNQASNPGLATSSYFCPLLALGNRQGLHSRATPKQCELLRIDAVPQAVKTPAPIPQDAGGSLGILAALLVRLPFAVVLHLIHTSYAENPDMVAL